MTLKKDKKKRETPPAKENAVEDCGRDLTATEENAGRIQNASAIFALLCCCASLYMQYVPIAIFCFCVGLVLKLNKTPPFLEKHWVKIFAVISALIVCFGIAVRIAMYAMVRSLWLDEALFAESIAGRNWSALLASPLSNVQSAPVLYVVTVKAICSVFGYSEFSLRLFSLLSFLGLLVCELLLLKKGFKADNIKTAFVLMLTAVVPIYVYYSNELKPYMSDAFFVVLTLLLYVFYTQNKISLIKLTGFYVLIFGFCSPAIFFIGGILTAEFLTAAFARDKNKLLHVLISGLSIVALFGLYYYWWMLPAQNVMDAAWNKSPDKTGFNAFFIILAILLYFVYTLHARKRQSLKILTLFYALILLLCPPTLFFIGGILAIEFLVAVFAKDKTRIVSISVSALSIAVVFGLYYQARTSFVAETLNDFWNNHTGKTELITGIKDIFLPRPNADFDSGLVWALVPLALLGIYSLFKQKNKVAYAVALSMLFVCLASSIGKWPLSGRLWLFLPAIVLVFSSVGFDLISKGNNAVFRRVAFCLFSAITIFYTAYHQPSLPSILKNGITIRTEEVNPLILYVKTHINKDEKLYVYPRARYTLMFKNGYNNYRIGQTDRDNIIYGVNRDEWDDNKLGAELDTIIKSRKAYLLFQHYSFGIEPGLAVLQQYGTITLVLNNNNTPLFYFEANE